ncbi:MAG: DUF2225 domain-containing protein [Defluviitaleaceae bacterium]|nr:DUF2225 domain-containing protein [Defluviitaleaceae bacterium]
MQELLAGIEKFGLGALSSLKLFQEKTEKETVKQETAAPEFNINDVTYIKSFECGVCGTDTISRIIRTGKMSPVSSDFDLRPVYSEPIHPIFYDIVICTKCGHTALSQTFPRDPGNIPSRRVQEQITPSFKPASYPDLLTADMALERFKLALLNAVVKQVKNGEKAYLCMKIAWLYRIKNDKKNELLFIENAYNGFNTAISTERFPLFGLDENTVMYILACYAKLLGQLGEATKIAGKLILTPQISPRLKDRAMDLKDEILKELKKAEEDKKG